MGGDRQGATRQAQGAREVGCEGVRNARRTRTVRVKTGTRGADRVLSEIATGKRGPSEDCQPGDERMFGLLQYSLYGTRDAAQNWEEEPTSTLSDLKLMPLRVVRMHQGKDVVATVHRRHLSWASWSLVCWGHHERRTLPQGMDQEAASCIAVFCRERAVRRSRDRVKIAGSIVWVKLARGYLSNNVTGQPQGLG